MQLIGCYAVQSTAQPFRLWGPIMKAVLLFAIFVLFAGAAFAQDDIPPSASPAVEEVYLAKDDGNGKAGEQVTEFGTDDIPIFCVVLLNRNAKVTVKMNFVAVSVAGVKPETKVVTASYTTKETQNRVNFTGRPDGVWTPGTYRVDLFIDGRPATDLEFEIKGISAKVKNAANGFQGPVSKPKPKPSRLPKKRP
ncbi:MAG: hypothetical protein WBO10_07050 [Pyrinomonadaceae bacterium]